MKKRLLRLCVTLVVATLVAGCGGVLHQQGLVGAAPVVQVFYGVAEAHIHRLRLHSQPPGPFLLVQLRLSPGQRLRPHVQRPPVVPDYEPY